MAQDSIVAGERFEIGRVISTSISVFSRNIGPFAVITLLIAIPYILISFWMAGSIADMRAAAQAGSLPPGFFGMIAVTGIVLMLTSALSQSAINYGTFQDLRGQRPSFGECLSRGLSMLPKVVIGAILASLAYAIGFVLLFVPGVILLLMWWVFIPVILVEDAGITQAFGRSRALTKGHRWGILGLFILVGIVQGVAAWLAGFIGGLIGPFAAEIMNLAVTLIFTSYAAVLCAVGYYFLRVEKEGIVIDDIARVFD